jgi:hypothetical protein
MKLLVNINQKASIVAGYDATNSTEVIEIAAADIPQDLRAEVAEMWDAATGKINPSIGYTTYSEIPTLTLAMPITRDAVIERLQAIVTARAAKVAALKAEQDRKAADLQAKRDAVAEATPLMIAELDSYIPGSFGDSTKANLDNASFIADQMRYSHGLIDAYNAPSSPELNAAVERAETRRKAWRAAKAEAEAAAKREAAEAAAQERAARIVDSAGTTLEVIVETGAYNDRRYGKPWLATCDPKTLKIEDFQDWTGRPGMPGEFRLTANPLAVLAQGQKDHRKNRGGVDSYGLVVPGADGNVEWYSTPTALRAAIETAVAALVQAAEHLREELASQAS